MWYFTPIFLEKQYIKSIFPVFFEKQWPKPHKAGGPDGKDPERLHLPTKYSFCQMPLAAPLHQLCANYMENICYYPYYQEAQS